MTPKPATPQRSTLFPAALAVLALLPASPSVAQSITCRPNYDFAVEVEGSYPKEATFYQSDARGKFFIDVPACKAGLLMDLTAKKVQAVPRDRVKPTNGGVEVPDGAPDGAPAYAFSIDGPIIQFEAEDKKVRILPCLMRPPIVGPVEMEALVSDRPEYREGMKLYSPNAAAITRINKYGKKVQIDAFFATWCSHCKEHMPKFLRVMSEVKNPNLKLNLYGVPKGFSTAAGPWQGRNINSIPTIIVKIDGREITRMGAQPGATPELELADIFEAVK
ncbi:MAG TPA: thioredoxin family protein [Candidatus Polarisedimenticolia bacterium]|nr:thioredoxin family protein [Candidatus Polarisedimenticolia bacterium]